MLPVGVQALARSMAIRGRNLPGTEWIFEMRNQRIKLIAMLGASALLALGLVGCGQSASQLKAQSSANTTALAAYQNAHPPDPKAEIAAMTAKVEAAGYIPEAQKQQIIAQNTAGIEAEAAKESSSAKQ
jgi:hypothetical protein